MAAPSAFPCDLSLYTNIGRTTVCENESFELYVAPKQSLTSPEVWKFTFTGVGLGSNYTSWAKSAVIPASTIGAGSSRTYTILLEKFPTYNDAQLNTNRICSNNVNSTIDVIAAVSAPTVSPDVTACEGDPAPTFSVTNY